MNTNLPFNYESDDSSTFSQTTQRQITPLPLLTAHMLAVASTFHQTAKNKSGTDRAVTLNLEQKCC